LSFLRNVLTGCGAHKASYSIRTGGSSSVGQVTLTWVSPLHIYLFPQLTSAAVRCP